MRTNAVKLAVFVRPHWRTHLAHVLRRIELVFVDGFDELTDVVRLPNVVGAVVDPLGCTEKLAQLQRTCPATQIVLYVEATPEALLTVFKLGQSGVQNVFVHPVAYHCRQFHIAIDRLTARGLSSALLNVIDERVRSLPGGLYEALVDVFARPYRYQSVGDIAKEAGVSIQSVQRAFRKRELRRPREILAIAKVAYGCGLIYSTEQSISKISDKLGYAARFPFTRRMQRYAGETPSRLRRRQELGEASLSLVENLLKPPRPRRERPSRLLVAADDDVSLSAPPDTAPTSRPASRTSTP